MKTMEEFMEPIAMQVGIDPDGEVCVAREGLIEEPQDLLDQLEDAQPADAAIIGVAQKMEHYEIAAYGTARTLAQQAGQDQVVELLQQTLQKEKATDEKLTVIATSQVNQMALNS
ncbi:DUF892 family protein [Larkinella sp. VNQ87]|uniref:DUF892 family protein n=1 Tax=Larkinella sp. VNQ87 TaxID=3400921 RepID=UPI003C01907A